VNKELLELWGQTLLEMARMAKGTQAFFNLFQNGFAKPEPKPDSIHEQFINLCQKMFGKEGIEAFNSVFKEFYENIGVVPRTRYNELHDRYEKLKEKVWELEEKIEELKKNLAGKRDTPSDLIVQWIEAVRKYGEINRQFFEEFSKFFKQ